MSSCDLRRVGDSIRLAFVDCNAAGLVPNGNASLGPHYNFGYLWKPDPELPYDPSPWSLGLGPPEKYIEYPLTVALRDTDRLHSPAARLELAQTLLNAQADLFAKSRFGLRPWSYLLALAAEMHDLELTNKCLQVSLLLLSDRYAMRADGQRSQ